MTKERTKQGKKISLIGILANAFLALLKITIGLGSGSLAILGDGVNNFFDTASAGVSLFSFYIAGRPSDKEHPFGHARAEYIGSFIIAMAILYVAVTLFRQGFLRILDPRAVSLSTLELALMIASVLVKVWLYFYYHRLALRLHSELLRATAADTWGDILATSSLVLALFLSPRIGIPMDGPFAIVVGLLIGKSGWEILTKNFNELLGVQPQASFVHELSRDVKSYPGVMGIHDVIVHAYGPGRRYVTADIEVEATASVKVCHDLVSQIEEEMEKKYAIFLTIHVDPVETQNARWIQSKEKTERILQAYHADFALHDFRLYQEGEREVLAFEVAVPWEDKLVSEGLADQLRRLVAVQFPEDEIRLQVKRDYKYEEELSQTKEEE